MLNKLRKTLVRRIPFNVQVHAIRILANATKRLVRHPTINYRGVHVYLLRDDLCSAMILVGYAYWGRWHHESGAQPIIESLIRARNQPVFFIDGGASFGMYSFLAASIDKVAKVIAVEAAQRTFECLQRSVEESEYSARIECIHAGLADSVDRKIFNVIEKERSESNSIVVAEKNTDIIDTNLTATTVDALVRRLALKPNDTLFVKLDIEGSEVLAVEGMRETLASERDALFMLEFHTRYLNQTKDGALARILHE